MGFADLMVSVDVVVRGNLGGNVTYTPGVGVPVEVDGVFDNAFVKVDAGTPGIATTGPAVFLTLTDLPSDPVTDLDATVTISGTTYTPYEAHPDGLGGVFLLLHLV